MTILQNARFASSRGTAKTRKFKLLQVVPVSSFSASRQHTANHIDNASSIRPLTDLRTTYFRRGPDAYEESEDQNPITEMHRYHQNLFTAAAPNGVSGKVVFKKRMTKIDEANRRHPFQEDSLERMEPDPKARQSLDSEKPRKPRRLYENRPSTAQPPSLSKNRQPTDRSRILHGQEVLSEGRDDLLGLAKKQREEQFHCYMKYQDIPLKEVAAPPKTILTSRKNNKSTQELAVTGVPLQESKEEFLNSSIAFDSSVAPEKKKSVLKNRGLRSAAPQQKSAKKSKKRAILSSVKSKELHIFIEGKHQVSRPSSRRSSQHPII